MTSTYAVNSRFTLTFTLFVLFIILTSIGCNKAGDASNNTKTTPANVAAAVKPAEPETKKDEAKKDDAKPVGREMKPADGPKLKSIEPVEGTILVGKLNDLAIELPQPDPEAAKAANESGIVTVEVIVKENGEVSTMSVVSGPTSLWKAAGAAARKARFDPPLHNGKPTKIAGVLTYEFKK
ncbi:MAG: TonB family protein [Chloracidobacterium sp.]|nr:TonB family protein [Chloracidobacterium sp.]